MEYEGFWSESIGLVNSEGKEPYLIFTPLKIKMEPENESLEEDFPFQTGDFQVPC